MTWLPEGKRVQCPSRRAAVHGLLHHTLAGTTSHLCRIVTPVVLQASGVVGGTSRMRGAHFELAPPSGIHPQYVQRFVEPSWPITLPKNSSMPPHPCPTPP